MKVRTMFNAHWFRIVCYEKIRHGEKIFDKDIYKDKELTYLNNEGSPCIVVTNAFNS